MSRRQRLIRRWLLLGGLPVVAVAVALVVADRTGHTPYVAGEETEGITRTLDRGAAAPGEDPVLRFTDVTAEAGVGFRHFPFRRTGQLAEDMGSGAAWGDYDGDGLDDLFLPNLAAPLGVSESEMARSQATDRLYRNRGDGTFEDVTAAAGVGAAHRANGAAWADYDDDGHLDLFVTAWGDHLLWHNRGDGTFEDATEPAGLAVDHGFWNGETWSDIDRDGDLDVYVCGYVQYVEESPEKLATRAGGNQEFPFTLNPSSWPSHANRLFVNRGDGTFKESSGPAGVACERGKSLGAAWADLDADGWPDLYVANDVSDNALYLNQHDGTFEDYSYAAVVADYRGAMGIAVADWDADLDLDLFVTHWIAQENALYSSQLTDFEGDERASGLLFVDDADRVGLGQIALDLIGWGTAFVDFDNDGRLDLFVSNGSTFQNRRDTSQLVPMDPHLYWNRGADEGFYEVGAEAGIRPDPAGVGRGAAFSDWDRDGDVDIVACQHGGPVRLLRNDSRTGKSASLRFVANGRDAIGARIVAHVGDRAVLHEVGGGPSYLSQSSRDWVVGLGEADRIDRLEITWPDGTAETREDLAAGSLWRLEPGAEPARIALLGAGGELSREDVLRFWRIKREADGLLLARDWEQAEALLAELITLDPRHEDSLYDRGNCFLEMERYAEAIESWEALLVANAASARAWTQIGLVRTLPEAGALFDPARAAADFDEAHRLNPEQSGALILHGEALLAAGETDAAEIALADARGMNDRATSAYLLGAWIARAKGRETEATSLLAGARASLEAQATPMGVLGEGDTKAAHMAETRQKAAQRRLFADCVQILRVSGEGDPLACVEAEIAEYGRAKR